MNQENIKNDMGQETINTDEAQLASENTVTELLAQIEQLKLEKENNWNKYLSSEAEMANLRNRTERQIADAHKFAVDKFVRELLPLIDSIELGIQAAEQSKMHDNEEMKKFIEGNELLYKMFINMLEKFNVVAVNPVGDKLNPELHQAITTQKSDSHEPGTVIQVVQKGYLLNNRTIRPAMVIVSN